MGYTQGGVSTGKGVNTVRDGLHRETIGDGGTVGSTAVDF